MKDRIKKLRRFLNMTQQEFADRIGVKRNTIGQYEIGRNEPIDTVVNLICREFNVNEEWLRTGNGEMFKAAPTDVLDQLAEEYKLSNAAYIMIEKFLNLSPEKQNAIYDYFHEVDMAIMDDDLDPYAKTAPHSTTLGFPMDKLIKNARRNLPKTPGELENQFPSVEISDKNKDTG